MCMICEAAPREVRFRCGHAVCCGDCVARVQAHANLCPQCRAPLGADPIADAGAHVQLAATFQIACGVSGGDQGSSSAASSSGAASAAGGEPATAQAGGRARRPRASGRGGRGLGRG